MLTEKLTEEIIALIDAEVMRDHLLKNWDRLETAHYRDIIAGAPVSLTQKQALLARLATESGDEAVRECLESLCDAMNSLAFAVPGESVLLAANAFPGEPGEDVFPAATYAGARRTIAACNAQWTDAAEKSGAGYWELRLYWLLPDGTAQAAYTYLCAGDEEPRYFRRWGHDTLADRRFCDPIPSLNLPVPYRPGDILAVDCRPYARRAYCLILEVGDDCCGVQCLFRDKTGRLQTGAFKHGHYFEEAYGARQYLSPLYRAEPHTGPLPEEYAYLEPISQQLKKDPDYGKTLWKKINGGLP